MKFPFIAVAAMLLLASCNDDDGYSLNDYYAGWGTVVGSNDNFHIRLDGSSNLYISATLVPVRGLEDGQRLIAYFTILGDAGSTNPQSYYIRLNDYYKVLTKDPVLQSDVNEDPELEGEMGEDNVDMAAASFGWNYLNIKFGMRHTGSVTHRISLVRDDVTEDPLREDSVYLYLRHNAMGDNQSQGTPYGTGLVSFDISSIVPSGKTQVPVKLIWTGYDGVERYDKGTFKLKGQSGTEPLSENNTVNVQ